MRKIRLLLAVLPLVGVGCAGDSAGITAPDDIQRGLTAVNFTVAAETYTIYNGIPWDAGNGGQVLVGLTDANQNNSLLGTVEANYDTGSFTQPAGGRARLSAYPYSGCVFLYWEINSFWGDRVYDDLIYVDDYPPSDDGQWDYHAYFECEA